MGFVASEPASTLLDQIIDGLMIGHCNSCNRDDTQVNSAATALYLESVLDRYTTFWRFEDQEMSKFPRNTQ